MPHERLSGLRAALPGVAAPLALFGLLAGAVATHDRLAVDHEILHRLAAYYDVQPWRWVADAVASVGGEFFPPLPLLLAAAIPVGLCLWHRVDDAAFFVAAVVPAVATSEVLKHEFVRPPLEGGAPISGYFPSGHATGSAAVAAALVVLRPRTRLSHALAVGAIVFAVAYGLSLVFLWDHYPSDVMAGWCLAVAWTNVLAAVFPRRAPTRAPGRARRARAPSAPT